MNELIVQSFFWGDTAAFFCALWFFLVYTYIIYLSVTETGFTSAIEIIHCAVALFISAYIILIYVSLYGEAYREWLSMIF